MDRKQIIETIEREFIKEDKKEPYLDREYVDETKRIFKILKQRMYGKESKGYEIISDSAIYDIVTDLIRFFRIRRYHISLESIEEY